MLHLSNKFKTKLDILHLFYHHPAANPKNIPSTNYSYSLHTIYDQHLYAQGGQCLSLHVPHIATSSPDGKNANDSFLQFEVKRLGTTGVRRTDRIPEQKNTKCLKETSLKQTSLNYNTTFTRLLFSILPRVAVEKYIPHKKCTECFHQPPAGLDLPVRGSALSP